jgi:hypothetical protein
MAGQNRTGMKTKSVQDLGTLGHFAKTDIRYGQSVICRQTYTRGGKTLMTKNWATKIVH